MRHEALSYGNLYSMDPVARAACDERKVAALFKLIRQSCVSIESFTAVEDYCLGAQVRDYCNGQTKRTPDESDEWTQQLLAVLSRTPDGMKREPGSSEKRPVGRPPMEFRIETCDQLITGAMRHGLIAATAARDAKVLLSFFDEVVRGVEFQFHAAWSSHTLSPRWTDRDDQILTKPETFSEELGRLRAALGKRARSQCQSPQGT